MKKLVRAISITLLLSHISIADGVKDHIVGVQRWTVRLSLPLRIRQVHGSGVCISQSCSVVATAYHTQMLVGRANLQVAGAHTEKVLSLTNESDANRTDVPVAGEKRILSYNVAKDIAFLYTKKPVRRKSGAPHSYHCYVGQTVEVASYNGNFETRQARIIGLNVHLVMGKVEVNENLMLDISMNPGDSGSGVFDKEGNLLGMVVLVGAVKLKSGDLPASLALPVRTIAKTLMKLDPALGSVIFNNMPEEEPIFALMPAALYQEIDLPEDTSPVIPQFSAVPADVSDPVSKLRARSLAASQRMVNFIAKQCLVQGTQKPLCHEVSIVGDQQRLREIVKNGELGQPMTSFSPLTHGIWTISDWGDTLGEIAENPWVFQGSVDENYLFTFKSAAEDDRCYYEEYPQRIIPLFGGAHPPWKGPVACFQQVLADKDFKVLAVFVEMRPPDNCLTESMQTAIYFEWKTLTGLELPVLLPVVEKMTAKVKGQKELLYSKMSWTDYKKFRADHRINFPADRLSSTGFRK